MPIPSSIPIEDRKGFMIGAWGFGFFESDHDYDIVAHLSADMGLWHPDPSKRESLLNPNDQGLVRKRLIAEGQLVKVFDKYHGMLKDFKIVDIKKVRWEEEMMLDSPRYYMFLLGLLGMLMGVTIPKKILRWMRANVNACLFTYERIDQARKAVVEYKNGVPYELGSMTVQQKMMMKDSPDAAAKKAQGFGSVNVPNDALIVSLLRMMIDNEYAQSRGATATKGVDISGFLPDTGPSMDLPTKTKDAPPNIKTQQAATVIAERLDEASKPKPEAAKSYFWRSNSTQDDRIAEHKRMEKDIKSENLDQEGLKALLGKFAAM